MTANVKLIYSEKATKICQNLLVDLLFNYQTVNDK